MEKSINLKNARNEELMEAKDGKPKRKKRRKREWLLQEKLCEFKEMDVEIYRMKIKRNPIKYKTGEEEKKKQEKKRK